MNIPESMVVQVIDEILLRSTRRLNQQRIDIQKLPEGVATIAQEGLSERLAAIARLKAYRQKLV